MSLFGYARVSTDGQSLTAQVAELRAASCQRIFQEKVSGARSDRKQLARLIAGLDRGDILVVTRPLKLTPHQRREAVARREAGEILTDIARTFNVSHSTISRLRSVDRV